MPTLEPPVIAGLFKLGGVTGSECATYVAIALAESGGDTEAKGGPNSNGTFDHGLLQINDTHGFMRAQLLDPSFNVQTAISIKRRQGFNAWSAYKNGKYRQHMSRAQQACRSPDEQAARAIAAYGHVSDLGGGVDIPSVPGEDTLAAVANAIKDGVQVIIDAGKWLTDTHNVQRIFYVGGGIVLAVGGAYMIARPTVEPITRDVKKAAKAVV